MIFATVGTHEQPMDRLFARLEHLVGRGAIDEQVVVQSGYTRFSFQRCEARPFLPIQEVERLIREARVVICHGGPATIMQARASGKMPVVVPRQHRFGEHVNDHQVHFCQRLADLGLVSLVLDVAQLEVALDGAAALATATTETDPGLTRQALCDRLADYCRGL